MNFDVLPAPGSFDELANWLISINSQFSPAELHGAYIGALSGGMRLSAREWSLFGIAVMGAGEHVASDSSEAVLGGIAHEQFDILCSDEMSLQPFLPDDDEHLDQRTAGMSDWCRGFLGGFAEAQAHEQAEFSDEEERFSDAVQESLRDIAAIAEASSEGESAADSLDGLEQMGNAIVDDSFFDESAEDSGLNEEGGYGSDGYGGEDAERDYMEVVEHLRLAAMTVFTEFGWVEMIEQMKAEMIDDDDGKLEANYTSDGSDVGLAGDVLSNVSKSTPAQSVANLFKPGNKTVH